MTQPASTIGSGSLADIITRAADQAVPAAVETPQAAATRQAAPRRRRPPPPETTDFGAEREDHIMAGMSETQFLVDMHRWAMQGHIDYINEVNESATDLVEHISQYVR